MSDYTLKIPEEVYNRARKIAEEESRPVEDVLIDHLNNLTEPLPALPPNEQAELDALKHLSDDGLRAIAAQQMPDDVQDRMQVLMDKNNFGTISADEYQELEGYVERGNRLMVRKAEAAHLLMQRGHLFSQKDFKPKHE